MTTSEPERVDRPGDQPPVDPDSLPGQISFALDDKGCVHPERIDCVDCMVDAVMSVISPLLAAKDAEIERRGRQMQSLARRLAVRFASVTELRDLLSRIWLYTNWRYVTGQLETQHKELWADVIDATGEPDDEPIERWWRNGSDSGRPVAQEAGESPAPRGDSE